MNPLYTKIATGLFRHLFSVVGAVLVTWGTFTQDEVDTFSIELAGGAALFVVGIASEIIASRWQRWKELLKLEASPGTPESTIDHKFNAGIKPMTLLTERANEPVIRKE